jgi:hypothetical protein
MLQMISESLLSPRWGEHAQAYGVAKGHLLGRQEWDDPTRVASKDVASQEGVIVASHITWVWRWRCAYMYTYTLDDNVF